MTVTPIPYNPYTWNGPVCPGCGKPYLPEPKTWTSQFPAPYQPRHRKPGPAQ